MRRRSLIVVILLNILISIGVAVVVIQLINARNTGGTSVTQVITVEVVYTATTGPTQTPFVITAVPPEGVVLLPTGLFPPGTGGTPGAQNANAATLDPSVLAASTSDISGGDLEAALSSGTLPENCVLHTIVEGDTPFAIAAQYEADGFELLRVNGLTEETSVFLQIGQVLIVPLEGCPLTQTLFEDTTEDVPVETPTVEAAATEADAAVTPTAAAATNTPTRTATLPPTAENAQMEILGVQSAGVVTAEYIEIRNNGNTVNISGWVIRDGQGNEYTFAEQFLFNRGSIRLFTGAAGQDTATVKYWRQGTAVWESGDTASLIDSAGRLQSTFVIP
ncbi:MAG: lamin tail domain-containing protein [bacterium]|nr:lamin tail domain-containing protein [bacterium]